MPSNPKVTPDTARATAPAMTPLPSAIASGYPVASRRCFQLSSHRSATSFKPLTWADSSMCGTSPTAENLRTSRPCGFEAETRVELPKPTSIATPNARSPQPGQRENRTPRVDRGPLKVALYPSSLAVGPLAFLLALLFVAFAFLLALPFVALRPLLIRRQITLQCSTFYVSSP